MEMSAGLSSKLLASTSGQVILEAIPWTPGVTKSLRVLLWSPPPSNMFVGIFLGLHLCSSIFCFFLLMGKVLLISGLVLYRSRRCMNGKESCKHDHQHYQRNKKLRTKNKILSHLRKTNSIVNKMIPNNGAKNLTTAASAWVVVV